MTDVVASSSDGHKHPPGSPITEAATTTDATFHPPLIHHLRLPLGSFLWAIYAILPSTVAVAVYNASLMAVYKLTRRILLNSGLIPELPDHDLPRRIGRLLMTCSLTTLFSHLEHVTSSHGTEHEASDPHHRAAARPGPGNSTDGDVVIAVFSTGNLWLKSTADKDMNPQMWLLEHIEIRVDAASMQWVSTECRYNGLTRQLDAMDTAAVVGHLSILTHAVLHTFANWGTDVHSHDPFIRKMSVTTVFYNWLGWSYDWLVRILRVLGLADKSWSYNQHELLRMASVANMIPKHGNIRQLLPFSPSLAKMWTVRAIFMATFKRHRDALPESIDPEALFLGSVFHGYDHDMCVEARLLDVRGSTPEMEGCASFVRTSVGSFSHDLPLLFSPKLRHATHPFFRELYIGIRKIDVKLADSLDCCIVK